MFNCDESIKLFDKNNEKLPITFSVPDNNILTILKATKADSGVYQCEAANAYSKSSSSTTILVDRMSLLPHFFFLK